MAQDQHNGDASWEAWTEAWRELLAAAAMGANATPWPAMGEALWTVLNRAAEDGGIDGERLRGAIRSWRHAARQAMPSATLVARCLHTLSSATPGAVRGYSGSPFPSGQDWPQLGPMQDLQARWERITAAVEGYQEALGAYLDELGELADGSVDALEEVLAERDDLDHRDPRAVFDLWCEVAEARYERRIADPAYTDALAQLTNRWAELRLALQPLIDDLLDALGMPSRRVVDETQAAVDRLRRRQRAENRALRDRLAALESRLGATGE